MLNRKQQKASIKINGFHHKFGTDIFWCCYNLHILFSLDKLSSDVNSLRVDFENGRQELWESISELEDRIQVVNQSVLTGYAEAFSLVSSNFSNLTLGSGNESDPLQIRQIWAGIAQNEIRLKDLQKETEMMESIMADVGVGGNFF